MTQARDAVAEKTDNQQTSDGNLHTERLGGKEDLQTVRDLQASKKAHEGLPSEFPSANLLLAESSEETPQKTPPAADGQPADKSQEAPAQTEADEARKEQIKALEELLPAIAENVGKSADAFVKGIDSRVACASAVSGILHESNPDIKVTTNNKALERNLKEQGYEAVPLDQAKPGDVIIGKRPNGMPGHAAIYMGDGVVFNNNSDSGKMQLDSVDKFKHGMHDDKGHWNKNGYSEVVVYRKVETQSADGTAGDTGKSGQTPEQAQETHPAGDGQAAPAQQEPQQETPPAGDGQAAPAQQEPQQETPPAGDGQAAPAQPETQQETPPAGDVKGDKETTQNALRTDWGSLDAKDAEQLMTPLANDFGKELQSNQSNENAAAKFQLLGQSLEGADAIMAARVFNDALTQLGLSETWTVKGDSEGNLELTKAKANSIEEQFSKRITLKRPVQTTKPANFFESPVPIA